MDAEIRPVNASDSPRLAAIYNHYILHTTVSFEEDPLTPSEMEARITATVGEGFPWLVAAEGENVLGYAYATQWKRRSAYRFSAESTVYLDPAWTGRGLGSRLYDRLIPILKSKGVHTVIAGIALPNAASVTFHERAGFKKTAHFREVGFKLGQWVDVGYWQRILEE